MATVASYTALVRTHDQARTALGRALTSIGAAYRTVDETSRLWGQRESSRELLDSTRALVEKTYQRLRAGGGTLPDIERTYVGRALQSCEVALRTIDESAQSSLASDFAGGFQATTAAVGAAVGQAGKVVAQAAASTLGPLWPLLILAGAGAVIYLSMQRRFLP
jgi:hypothetical protein